MPCISIAQLLVTIFALGIPSADPQALNALSWTDAERLALDTAIDGSDPLTTSLLVVADRVRQLEPEAFRASAVTVLTPRLAAEFLADPAAARGGLVLITGRLAQISPLEGEFSDLWECYIRLRDETPVLVFVAAVEGGVVFRERDAIEIPAMFLQTTSAEARDGRRRTFAVFVGAFPRSPAAPPPQPARGPERLIVPLVIGLSIVFLIVLALSRRSRRGEKQRRLRASQRLRASALVDVDAALPDDSAPALDEPPFRAEDHGRHDAD